MRNKLITVATLALMTLSVPAHAQFGGLPNLMGGSKDSAPAVNTDEVKATIAAALVDLSYATSKYEEALGNDKLAAEYKATAEALAKKGSAGVDASDITKAAAATDAFKDQIKSAADLKTKISEAGRKAAAEGLLFHVKATIGGVKGGKMIKEALSSKSMAAISALSGLKDFPGLLSAWTGTSSVILDYLKDNDVDTKAAVKALSDGMK